VEEQSKRGLASFGLGIKVKLESEKNSEAGCS